MLNNETTESQVKKLFEDGGLNQQGGENQIDEVSGNDVPVGAMKEEVRDDIDAKLSEGEFVFPADVVRFIGLEKLMMMRDKAKTGLQRMEEIGQMGNASEVENPEALHSAGETETNNDEEFSSAVDQAMMEVGKQEFASGGYVEMEAGGIPSITQQTGTGTPLTKFSMKTFTNAAGQTLYIPFLGTEPLLQVPDGYTQSGGVTSTTPETGGGTASSQGTGKTGGGESPGMGNTSQGTAWDSMTQAEQAAFYASSPTFSAVTSALQAAFSFTSLGKIAAALDPGRAVDAALVARGIDPSDLGQPTDALDSFDADNADAIASAEAAIAAEASGPTSEASHGADGNNSGVGFGAQAGGAEGALGDGGGNAGTGGGGDGGGGGGGTAGAGVGGAAGGGGDSGGWAKGGFISKKSKKNKQKSLVSKK
jgi:hypothetical protein